MRVSRHFRPVVACLFLAVFGATSAAAEPPVNLLRLPQAKLESTSLMGERAAALPALTDGKPDTAAELDPGGAETIDLVFGFAGETMAPQTIVVTISKRDGAVPPARVEVLASTVSPHAGFQSLRGDPINATAVTQEFAFTPTGARWIMIRLTVAKAGAPVSLAEIELLGHQGPPATVYEFGETPARAIDILSRLATASSVKLSVSPDEKLAFEKARGGRLDAAGLADVALLASGVLDPARRKAYLARIDALAAKARAAVGTTANPAERADALLRWLHREALAKGYRTTQTDLSVLLDEQTFNCVSSAVIYNILALRLGLDARAIEVPDHAFSIVYQGTIHMDVETTNPQGFNPARDPRQVERFERMTGFRYVPEAHRDKRREVTEAGLAAIIYYNKGVELGKAGRHHDALLAYFRAMSLDPDFASAATNALATLANWSVELAEQRQWQQAVDVAAVGVTLAPKDARLASNQAAVWQRWALSLADAGQPGEAIAVLKRAAAASPKGGFEAMQAWVYIKPAEDLVKARNWQAALAATEPGLAKLDPVPRQELVKWRDSLFLRWANAEIEGGRFEAAAAALSNGLAARADDQRLLQTVAYLAQEWAKKASADGFSKGLAVFAALDRQFPTAALNNAKLYYVERHVKKLVDAGRVDDGLAAVVEAAALLKPEETRRLALVVYDTRANALMKAGAWSDAADLYARGLKQFPGDRDLRNNVLYLAQEWQKAAYAKGGTPEVAAVSATLAAKFPGIAELHDSGGKQMRQVINDLVRAGDFSKALETVKTAAPQLAPADVKAMNELIYDNWAQQRMAAKDWSGAADIYAAGLAAIGPSDHLRNNVLYLAQEWQKAAYAKGGAPEVAAVSATLAAKFPGIAELRESGGKQIRQTIDDQVRAGDFSKALETVKTAAPQLAPADVKAMNELIYDSWAQQRMAAKDWPGAADIYAAGLAATGPSDLLRNNVVYLAQEWSRAGLASGGVDAVIQIARQVRAKFPGVADVGAGPAAIISNAVRDKANAADFAGAIAIVERAGEILPADRQRQLLEFSYDRWARSFMDKKLWDEAVKVYDQGLARLPDSGLFKQNRAYCLAQRK